MCAGGVHTSPDYSSSDDIVSSSKEEEHLPEAIELSDEDSDMEYEDVSTGRDKGMYVPVTNNPCKSFC